MTKKLTTLSLLGAVLAALVWPIPAQSDERGNPNPGVLPPDSTSYGKTYGEWGAAWWQWELRATIDANPVLDTTGEFAYVNQSGPVFFLAGTFGGNAVRNVTVPAGKAFFLPLQNWVLTYPEDVPADVSASDAEAWMRQLLNDCCDIDLSTLVCEVDGAAVQDIGSYRAQSEAFNLYLPEDCASVTDWLSWQSVPYAAGWHYPNVSDGYWVMLAPLSAGQHVIHIQVAGYLDVIYNLTVRQAKK